MNVVYVDCVFLLNALMDAAVLLATAHLAGIPPQRLRFFLASVLGGAYSAAVFLPGGIALASWPGKLAAGTVMALTAFGGRRYFLRLLLLFLAVSCGFAGCIIAVGMVTDGIPMEQGIFYTNVDTGVLLAVAAAAYLVFSVVFRASAAKGVRGLLVPVTLAWGERRVSLTALCDTGNVLKDPVTGYPVLVAEVSRLRELFPPELRPLLQPSALRSPAELLGRLGDERVRFRLLPYQAVGVSGGMLLAVRLDWGEVGGKRHDRLVAALSPTELGDGFSALWGAFERSEAHEYQKHFHKEAGRAAGTCASGGSSVYRRE